MCRGIGCNTEFTPYIISTQPAYSLLSWLNKYLTKSEKELEQKKNLHYFPGKNCRGYLLVRMPMGSFLAATGLSRTYSYLNWCWIVAVYLDRQPRQFVPHTAIATNEYFYLESILLLFFRVK